MNDPALPHGETSARAVLDRLRAKREAALPTRIPRLARQGDAYPLSDGQERLWLIDRMLPGNAAYNIAAAVELAGPLDPGAFAAALTEIVRRHETLRTSFQAVGDQPVQVIAPTAGSPLHRIDLDGLADGRPIAERLVGAVAAAPFDLARGALLRVALLRLGPEEHWLILALHHIVSDGWSLRVLLRETRILYQAWLQRAPSPLPELAVQYVDFVAWQRCWLAGEAAARQLAYWKEQLGERPPILQLPGDRPPPAVQSLRGRSLPLALAPDLSAAVGALTRRSEATPFVTLLAAFQALLHRLSGEAEILVGFPVANRKRPEVQDLIGFFVNTLALKAEFPSGLRFCDLLRRTSEASLGAQANQELPFGHLVKELQPARQTSHSPLVQVAFAYQNLEPASWSLPGLRLTPRPVPRESSMFDLRLDLSEGPRGFVGEIEYSTDLFDAATLARWAGHLEVLLAGVVADPERRIADLPLLSAAEEQQLREANDTAVRYPAGGRCLHALIAVQAARLPDAIAVVSEEDFLSYRELGTCSARWARQLERFGVGPDVRVGICLERSRELMIGLLAILTAGSAYVPLDPSYPRERLAHMIADSAVPVLLAQAATLQALPDLAASGVRVVPLDGAIGGPEAASPPPVCPDNLAYVIYTSGSTGRPKGVMNTHAGVVNRLLWMQAQYGLSPADHVLQKTPMSFDVSVWELFWPLATGACLVMARPGGHQDGAYLVHTIVEQGITTLHFVPSMLAIFLETPEVERCTTLQRVMASGEALSPALEQRYATRLRAPLYNLYGPTEAAVDVTFWRCDPAARRGSVPIGRPVANTAIHLLDGELRPVPLGVAGELHIGGLQLARGYAGRPELTAERFIPDPHGAGDRLYATGDLARRLPGGEIDYLGRLDHQVKIRGFRIELGEIEAVLGRHPEIAEAVVVAEAEPGGGARLVAYVVPDPEHATAIRALLGREGSDGSRQASRPELEPWLLELKRRVREELPEPMVPAALVALAALPLTPNGKVDRRALPASGLRERTERTVTLPRSPLEEILVAIWSAVLGVEHLGVEDDFFDLGGHSLLANQVVARICDSLGVELPLRTFFALPTVATLAERVEAMRRSGAISAPPPLVAGERRGDEPLSFAQQRLWFLSQLDPESTAYHVAVALRLTGSFSPPALASSFAFVVERHETLRTTFALRPEGPVQVVAPPAGCRLPLVDLARLGATAREVEAHRLAHAEAGRPFDLARGPLLRPLLLRLTASEHVLSLVLHHIISDGWSMGVLWREAMAVYGSAAAGRPPRLPPLPIQYRDFAAWQRRWLSGETLEHELRYWRRQLAGAPALLELPTDRARPPVQRFRGGRLPIALPAAVVAGLKRLSLGAGATLFMALLATFDVLLHRYSRQDDLVVGAPIAGRNRLEAEGLIGLFLNTLALRVEVEGDAGWRALLRRVREVTLDAYAHQELPFEMLVAELDLERNLAHAPLFQTLLVFQNTPAPLADLPGLAISPLDVGTGTAKFDLVLNVEETGSRLAGWLIYNRDLFDLSTVARARGHFQELVSSLLAGPEQRVDELPLLGPAERHQLLNAWSDTSAAGSEATFAAQFAAQAARTPDALAVSWGELQISYGELAERSSRLARGLATLTVGPEPQVAVLAERGIDLLITMLALFQLGAAYIPLDSHHPTARLEQTLAQSGSRLVLAAEPLRSVAAALATVERPAMAIGDLLRAGAPAGALPPPPPPANLAYVLFTSGSTGVPKGAMLEHRGMSNHLAAKIADLGLTASDRVAQTALQTFDISIWQLLAALLVGASVDILPNEVVRDPLRLLAEIDRRGITVFETVPSLLAALLQVEPDRRPALAALRWVIPTGEALSPALCRQWFAAYSAIPLVNAYGPTECSDDVTHQILRRPPPAAAARTPIGRPVANTRIHVLGLDEEPAPIGVPGELAVAGAQVGRGYWGRPDLTAAQFVPDPFSELPGGRLYRTGDLARFRPQGEVEFLSRIDHQVKVRGFRIELGDVEAALLSHPAVRDAVVLARAEGEERSGAVDRRLVAYLVAEEGTELALPELREWLQQRLPEYMVPAVFVMLAALPLTANGKIDRRALPPPETGATKSRELVAPQTALERHLASLWAESLGLSTAAVGVHDSYFDLGGNSILGAILINRLQRTLGEIVHVVALFDHPTVAAMAEYLGGDYPAAVARLWGGPAKTRSSETARVDREDVAAFRAILPARRPAEPPATRNPPAVFLLSAPRSGSTLLRIMLGGHPQLFAPPELELLSFETMAERRAAFSGRDAFWLEGLIRALMEIHRFSPEQASALIERDEAQALPTRLVYRQIQEWIGDRILVDKTPSYALGQDILERAETDFASTRYIHLARDPRAAIQSFEEAKLDQVFFRHSHPFTRRQLAELIWVVSHQNIMRFLAAIPQERQRLIRFEELVADPAATLARLCDFLDLPFHPDMVQPYKDTHTRMADGLYAESRMLGDVKFHQHSRVESSVARRWRTNPAAVLLGPPALEVASTLGYEIAPLEEPPPRPAPLPPALVPLQTGGLKPPLFLVHPMGGSVHWYLDIARRLGTEQTVYGLRAAVDPDVGPLDLPAMASRYLGAVHEVQAAGPYLLGGWSMGAVVAFEMARQLATRGEEVSLLAMIDPPPPRRTAGAVEDDLSLLADLVRDLEGLSGRSLGLARREVETLDEDARLAYVLSRSHAAGALPAELSLDDFRTAFAVFRQNRNALRAYVPDSYAGHITLFQAEDTLARHEEGGASPGEGWRELAGAGITTHLLAGSHYSILRTPAAELAERLRGALG